MARDDRPAERGEELDIGDIEIPLGDRLDHDAAGGVVETQPAMLLGKFEADQAERPHAPPYVQGDFAAGLDTARQRRQAFGGETLRRCPNGGVFGLHVEDRIVRKRKLDVHAASTWSARVAPSWTERRWSAPK